MAELKPMQYTDMLEIMLVESKNELQRTQIMERLAQRQNLRGVKVEMVIGQMASKAKSLTQTIDDLEDIHKDELAKKLAAENKK